MPTRFLQSTRLPKPEIWLIFDEWKGVDILADILQHSTLDQPVPQRIVLGLTVVQRCSCRWAICWSVRGHLDFERGVILRELEEVEKTTEEAELGGQAAAKPFSNHPLCTVTFWAWMIDVSPKQVIFDRLHLTAFHDSPWHTWFYQRGKTGQNGSFCNEFAVPTRQQETEFAWDIQGFLKFWRFFVHFCFSKHLQGLATQSWALWRISSSRTQRIRLLDHGRPLGRQNDVLKSMSWWLPCGYYFNQKST